MARLEIAIGKLRLRTPLIAVSGIFGIEYRQLLPELRGIGGVVAKSVTLRPRTGNPEPKIIETPAGLLNSIGLQNPGIKGFLSEQLPNLRVLEVPIIVSVAGSNIAEYVRCCRMLADRDEIDAIELNLSCPNVETGLDFGSDPKALYRLVSRVRKAVPHQTLIAKLTPNITDIALPAQAAVDAGVQAISLINTLRAMAIDLQTARPKLGNKVGGLSGRAVHPVAVYMVYRCYTACCRKNDIPIIGMGGVCSGEDAIELILAGASAVGIGTAMFRDPAIFQKVAEGLRKYLEDQGKDKISDIVGLAARS